MSSSEGDEPGFSRSPDDKPVKVDAATVLDATSEGILIVDNTLRVLWMNKRFRDLAEHKNGSQPDVNMVCFELLHDRSEPCTECEALKVFQTGRRASCVHRSPEDRCWESVASPIFDADGRVTKAVIVVRDVTERVFLESRI